MAPPPPAVLAELSLVNVELVTDRVSAAPSAASKSIAPPLLPPAESEMKVHLVTVRSPPCCEIPPPGELELLPSTLLAVMTSLVRVVLSPAPPAEIPAPFGNGVVVSVVAPPETVRFWSAKVIDPDPLGSTAKTCWQLLGLPPLQVPGCCWWMTVVAAVPRPSIVMFAP